MARDAASLLRVGAIHMRSTAHRGILAAVFVMLSAAPSSAAQFPAWGDTGWTHTSKRECCNDAIAIAQGYSADACANTGGVPRPPMGGGNRGSCSAEWMQDADGVVIYRCVGEAAVWCR